MIPNKRFAIPRGFVEIQGYAGRYAINNKGDVFSIPYGKLLAGDINRVGYKRIVLCDGKTKKRYFIHRLVADVFIPNPDNKPQINHIDGNKLNNRANNLEWVSGSENLIHAWGAGLIKITPNFIQEQNRKIPQRLCAELTKKYKKRTLKASAEAEKLGVSVGAIYKAIYKNTDERIRAA